MAEVDRGEVWWYEDPHLGARPYLILYRSEAIGVMAKILGVPATRRARGIPTEVSLDTSDGMPEPCVLSLDNVQPIRKALCTHRITRLSGDRMYEVCLALSRATGC